MATSQNGWTVIDSYSSPKLKRLGGFSGSVHHVVHPVFEYLIAEFSRRVEPINIGSQDDWGYTPKKISGTDVYSNHASGTAIDLNSRKHEQGKRGTFTSTQVREIREILKEVDDVVQWGGDWNYPDEMHFEIRRSVSEQKVREVAARLTETPHTVTVKAGDGWWQTARKAGVSMEDLLEANNATLERVLNPEEKLAIPGRATTVRAGEGWWQISARVGVSMPDLVSANNSTLSRVLHPGEILKVG